MTKDSVGQEGHFLHFQFLAFCLQTVKDTQDKIRPNAD